MGDHVTGPLDGIRVIEVGTLISGPFAGRLLGDMGAEVIKVEPPGAPDPLRTWGQAGWTATTSSGPCTPATRRPSPSTCRKPAAAAVPRSGQCSDIIVENFRPGTLEKWGLGYDVLRERNRGIILVRVSGYGQTGPESTKAGYASVAEAASGLRHMNGFPGGPPPRLACHLATAWPGCSPRRARWRRCTGGPSPARTDRRRGADRIVLGGAGIDDPGLRRRRRGPRTVGHPTGGHRPSNIYRSADGSWVVIAANQDTVFRRLCAAMGQPELAQDERFVNHVARGRNQDELDKIIGDWAAAREPADIIETLSEAGVISGPINTVAEVVTDPQLLSRGMIADHWDERIGRNVKGPGVVPVLSESPAPSDLRARRGRDSTTARCTVSFWACGPRR